MIIGDKMDIAKIMENSDLPLKNDEIKDFYRTVAQYILKMKGITAPIVFGPIDGNVQAICYITSGVVIKNGAIAGKNGPTYNLCFDLTKINDKSALNSYVIDQLPQKLQIIHTIAHEIEHAVQDDSLDKLRKYDNDYLIMAKERFCSAFTKYYWQEFRRETNAEIEGWQMTLEMLYDYSPEAFKKYGTLIENEIKRIRNIEKTVQMTGQIAGKTITLPASQMVTLVASGEIKKRPNYALTMYPILRHVYHEDGTKKDYQTLMQERDSLIASLQGTERFKAGREKEIRQFYEDIVNSDITLLEEKRNSEFQIKNEMENTSKAPAKPKPKHVRIKPRVVSKVILMEQRRQILDYKARQNLEDQLVNKSEEFEEEEEMAIDL